MGKAAPYTCALGGITDKGVWSQGQNERKKTGRLMYLECIVTDELMKFLNDDVLPRINTRPRYFRAVRKDKHTIWLQESPVRRLQVVREGEEPGQDAFVPFLNTFKSMLSSLAIEDPEKFSQIKHGQHKASLERSAPKHKSEKEEKQQRALATHSNVHL